MRRDGQGEPDGPSDGGEAERPRVSVVMANWQGERYIAAAIASVLGQSIGDLELLVADDASTDRSVEIAQAIAAEDPRLRVLPATANGGPSAARNRALALARGDWIAVMDSDDLMHPRRLEILLEAAVGLGADLVADDMAFFGETPGTGGRTLLGPLGLTAARDVDPTAFVDSGGVSGPGPSLGYLKALIRRSALGDRRYDPTLRVGEDFDFYLRVLLGGARLSLVPLPLYLYRRHSGSISHRLSVAVLEPLIAAHDAVATNLAARGSGVAPDLARALARRRRDLDGALRYERLVAALKARDARAAGALLLRHPSLARPLARSLGERLSRTARAKGEATAPARLLLVPPGGSVTGIDADAGRDGVLVVPPLRADGLDVAPSACALVREATRAASLGPVDVTVAGLAALDGLGLVPTWRRAEIWLTDAEAATSPALPKSAMLRRLEG